MAGPTRATQLPLDKLEQGYRLGKDVPIGKFMEIRVGEYHPLIKQLPHVDSTGSYNKNKVPTTASSRATRPWLGPYRVPRP